jgi:p-aminobenzoyl-glutamate transporter AbgT
MWCVTLAQAEAGVKGIELMERAYGPYAFGLVAVIVLIIAAVFVYAKIIKPMQETAVTIAVEQTKQTENLKTTAAHTESSLALARAVGEQNEKTASHLREALAGKG